MPFTEKFNKAENLHICLYPMELFWGNVETNIENLENAMPYIKTDTDILVLPETFATGFPSVSDTERLDLIISEDTGNSIIAKIKHFSAGYNMAIAGSLIVEEEGKRYNRAFFVTPDEVVIFADKKHLFTMAGEHRLFSPGKRRMSVNYKGWEIAMIVCYDIRFPVWCRNVGNEYDLLLAVANWPVTRVKAWEKLLMARAIENEAYVVGVNCKGIDDNGYEYDGCSMIVDFKGDSVGKPIEPFIYAELSYSRLMKFREKFPAWQDADRFSLI